MNGTTVPREVIPQLGKNGSLAWWARQGLNLRPLRCEHTTPTQICRFWSPFHAGFANIAVFRSGFVRLRGTNGTTEAAVKMAVPEGPHFPLIVNAISKRGIRSGGVAHRDNPVGMASNLKVRK